MKFGYMTIKQGDKWYIAKIQRRQYATTYKIISGPYNTVDEANKELYKLAGITK